MKKCPHCNCDMRHIGFSWYQCLLIPRVFNHQPVIDVEFHNPDNFNPLCLKAVKIT